MRKKIFTLLTLMLAVCSGAWADITYSETPLKSADFLGMSDGTPTAISGITYNGATISSGKLTWGSNWSENSKDIQISFTVSTTACKLVLGHITSSSNMTIKGKLYKGKTTVSDFSSTAWSIDKTKTSDEKEFTNLTTGEYTLKLGPGNQAARSVITSIAIYEEEGVTVTSEVLKSSYAVKVGDDALEKDEDTNGYSVEGTTITLSDDIQYISAPDDIKLVKTITYSDSSTKDEDVDVTFDGTMAGVYFTGTATINETDYTVCVKKNTTPSLSLSSTSGSITTENSYTVVYTKTVTLSGVNLVDGTYDVVADVAGTTISPTLFTVASGSVDQEFTITSTASSAATTVFTFGDSNMGVSAPTYTLSFSRIAQRSLSQASVSSSTTWDWKNAGTSQVLLTKNGTDDYTTDTDPVRGTDFLLAILPEIDNDEDFNSQAFMVNCQYPHRINGSNHFFQGSKITFTTTIPGTVQVIYSNTGNKNGTRYVIVNGTVDSEGSSSSGNGSNRTSDEIHVSAGTVTITAKQIKDEVETENSMLQISKVIFIAEPADPTTSGEEVYLTTSGNMEGWRAFYDADNGYTLDGNTKAYIATEQDGDAIKLKAIERGIPAATPVILYTTSSADSYKMTLAKASVAAYNEGTDGINLLQYTTSAVSNKYRLGYGDSGVGFYPYSGTPTSGAVILNVSSASARALSIVFDEEETGIKKIEGAAFDKENGAYFNLAGQRVAQPTKGLYIVNGKKVVIK